jgi:hypothetical protein
MPGVKTRVTFTKKELDDMEKEVKGRPYGGPAGEHERGIALQTIKNARTEQAPEPTEPPVERTDGKQ